MNSAIVGTCRFSKTINAPLWFVYDWCTDYREDDYKITGAKSRRLILEKTKSRVVYITQQKGAKAGTVVNIVTLRPPNGWHLNSIGDQRNETGRYHLRKLGPRSTKLDMVFKFKWKIGPAPARTEFLEHLNEIWDKYAAALENDYKRKKV